VVSAEFGIGKPDASIFRYALSRLARPQEQTVMLGDGLNRDIDGALAAGLRAIWVNRLGHARPADRQDVVEVSTLGDAVPRLNT
jgi:putative hydrolase of the HAD superfamily